MSRDSKPAASIVALLEDSRWLDAANAETMDRELRSLLAQATKGMSPIESVTAVVDWLGHLAISPGKMLALTESLVRKAVQLGVFGVQAGLGNADASRSTSDRRMQGEEWQAWPFNVLVKGHTLASEWLTELTTGVDGVSRQHEDIVAFMARQIADVLSPANNPLTNPRVIATTIEERGANLIRGGRNLADDYRRSRNGEQLAGTESARVGEHLGITPGKVVLQNELIELIQYEPTTKQVGAEPVMIIPAWIMKYYILDLTPEASLVRYLVEQGKTVFIVSWKNPTEEDRDLAMKDYLELGVMAALDAIVAITGAKKVHAVGYCLGGTLMSIAAALMARRGDDRLKTLSLFASMVDFREAGEIGMFLGDSMMSFLEALMRKQGYLGIENMTGAFTSLRVSDLVYEPNVNRYLLGKDRKLNGLLAWNTDGTRMPYRMHMEYLKNCYIENNLSTNRYKINGELVCIDDISAPSFVVGTVTDHVAPWKSVYEIHRLTHNELTFALTTGGHNAGIACGPEHPRRKYQLAVRAPGDRYIDPQQWFESHEQVAGSWWQAWNKWLDEHMSGTRVAPKMGAPRKGYKVLRDAPGEYVFG